MKLSVEAPEGALAGRPGEALEALADIAEADGADRDQWLEKALKQNGAAAMHEHVRRGSRYRAVNDFADHAGDVYDRAMASAHKRIRSVLERAAHEADLAPYRRLE